MSSFVCFQYKYREKAANPQPEHSSKHPNRSTFRLLQLYLLHSCTLCYSDRPENITADPPHHNFQRILLFNIALHWHEIRKEPLEPPSADRRAGSARICSCMWKKKKKKLVFLISPIPPVGKYSSLKHKFLWLTGCSQWTQWLNNVTQHTQLWTLSSTTVSGLNPHTVWSSAGGLMTSSFSTWRVLWKP